MTESELNDEATRVLCRAIEASPEMMSKAKGVFASEACEASMGFFGCMDTYYTLARLIPTDWRVYDMGCCWGFQSWFFRNHNRYVGVDGYTTAFFDAVPNAEFHHCTIERWLSNRDIGRGSFAICNYVPPWGGVDNGELVRKRFSNVYVFYPQTGTRQ